PFCGKCVIAERNLESVLTQLPDFPVYKCVVDYAPKVVERLQVTSAPSLKFLVNGEVVHTSFGIRTTDDLYYNLSPYVKKNENPYEDFDWGRGE
ncbi:MAG: thioredoxin family protein, partial [Thermicanus sp.]|nr:thioredoxin family protein [Thermicanus sp.]